MRKIVIILLFLTTLFFLNAKEKYFIFDNKKFEIAINEEEFVDGYENSKLKAIKFKNGEYLKVTRKIVEICQERGLDESDVFSPSKIIVEETLYVLSMAETFTLMQGNLANYGDKSFYLITNDPPVTEYYESDREDLRKYLTYIAQLWWSQQSGDKICDSCNAEVPYGKGGAYGYIENNKFYIARLYCDDCFNKYLADYKKYFDEDIIRKAREFNKR